MSKSLLQELQKAADSALKSENIEDGMKHLAKAFSLFSKETDRLENAHLRLQSRFHEVKFQLEQTNAQMQKKVTELNTISSYLNNILKNISQGILFIDLEGTITTYNDAAEKILGIQDW